MIDDLDLGFDEQDRGEKGRHRRGAVRRRQGKSGGGRGKTLLALALALILLGGIGGGAFYGFDRVQNYFVTPDYDGSGTGEVTVEIKQGALLADMADALVAADVVKSTKAFIEAAEENSRSKNIQPGTYKLRKQMSGDAAVAAMLDLKNRIVNGITIPEGLTAKTVYKRLSEKTDIPVKDFEAAAKDPDRARRTGLVVQALRRQEGQAVDRGLPVPRHVRDPAEGHRRDGAQADGEQLPHRHLEHAVRREGAAGTRRHHPVRGADRRLARAGRGRQQGRPGQGRPGRLQPGLQASSPATAWRWTSPSTTTCELTGQKTKASKDMTAAELDDPKNPYNRKLRGLVPSPINNPGKEALRGRAGPPPGKWLYFVAISKDGRSAFAETYAEHCATSGRPSEAGII